ncbi:hypothetical protein [Paracoccus homiensis]|uniref:hypothetical protein n=1 Tax=Paracoccus homiensis TaxID=364199 RepID=UPI0011142FD7|nr:hypothetical protein [Paracoccus homiensis]
MSNDLDPRSAEAWRRAWDEDRRGEILRDYAKSEELHKIEADAGPYALFGVAAWIGLGASLWFSNSLSAIVSMALAAGFLSRYAIDYYSARRAWREIHEKWYSQGKDLHSEYRQLTSADPPSVATKSVRR